jgi:hypothetical protein
LFQSRADAEQIKAEEATFSQVQSEFGEIAERAAILFSVLADLAHMGPTYLFSLTTFRELMTSSINEASAKCSAEPFSDVVCKIVTMNVHSFACRSAHSNYARYIIHDLQTFVVAQVCLPSTNFPSRWP